MSLASRVRRWVCLCCALMVVGAFVGCGGQASHIEPKIHPNGSIDRAFCQPRETIPSASLDEQLWTKVREVKAVPPGPLETPIRELVPPAKKGEATAVVAWGTFRSIADLPEHFLHPSVGAREPSRLKPVLDLVDHGLITEGTWWESLNDEVSGEDQRAACQELAELGSRLLPKTVALWMEREINEEVNATALADWMRGEGSRLVTELAFVIYDAGLRKKLYSDEAYVQSRLLAVARHHGIPLTSDAEGEEQSEKRKEELEAQLFDLLKRAIRTKDGGPIPRERFQRLFEIVADSQPNPNLVPEYTKEQVAEEHKKLVALFETVQGELFGPGEAGKAKFDAKVAELRERIMGLYTFTPPVNFHCRLEVPGHVLSTNGVVTDSGQVEWSFEGKEAFPSVYVMECHWVAPSKDAKMPDSVALALKNPKNLVELLRLVKANTLIATAVEECAKTGDLKPLKQRAIETFLLPERRTIEKTLKLLGEK
ncbi:MAG: hypothetical protein NT069_24660 [Planctomycetota bacterium]|nr:hypothetical protein [Planctomycetota bacterium]